LASAWSSPITVASESAISIDAGLVSTCSEGRAHLDEILTRHDGGLSPS
jgi:hypothetical protein